MATLGGIVRARRMALAAQWIGAGQGDIYKSLSADGNPEFASVLKVACPLGLRLQPPPAMGAIGRRPPTPSGPPRRGSSGSSTPTAPGTTTSGRTAWARRPRRPTSARRRDPIHDGREPGLRRRRRRPPRPDRWRDQVRRRSPLLERGSHRGAGGARPTGRSGSAPWRSVCWTPTEGDPAHTRHGVTHVTGLVLPMCPVAQGA